MRIHFANIIYIAERNFIWQTEAARIYTACGAWAWNNDVSTGEFTGGSDVNCEMCAKEIKSNIAYSALWNRRQI